MTLSAGTRLGPYEIVAPLGAGGMGEVYRARDARLGREVAIKVLPATLASDPERLKRFEKEARSASALNHPNIVTVYDVGSEGGTSYIAMELVSGDTLRALLTGDALPVKKLLAIAIPVGEGLAKAHESGIVHRDLKPENVMVTKDGLVKILDFGLAKLTSPMSGSGSNEGSNLPTMTGTTPGVVVGTVGYMSPEQASGAVVDFRSDQFAFGSILYEMATGKRAFQRKTAVDTLAAILNDEPEPIASLAPQSPAPLRWVVERCLGKEPRQRYAATHDLTRELETVRDHLTEASGVSGVSVAAPARLRQMSLAAIVLSLAALAAGIFVGKLLGRTSPPPLPRFQQLTFREEIVYTARFAPDGQTIVYGVSRENKPFELLSTRVGSFESRSMGLSADILSISSTGEMALLLGGPGEALNSGATLAQAPLAGGAPREVLENVQAADWSPDGKTLAVLRFVGGKDRLEYPIGTVLLEANAINGRPRISRDGRSIAVPVGDSMLSVDTQSKKAKVLSKIDASGHSWSSKGDELWAFVLAGATSELRAIRPGGSERVVATLPGNFVLHDIAASGLVLAERVAQRGEMLVRAPGETQDRSLAWLDMSVPADISPDGRTVLFTEGGSGTGGVATSFLRKTNGTDPVRLGEGAAMALSPDGKWTLVARGAERILMPTGAGEPRTIKGQGVDFADGGGTFFADGHRLLLSGSEKGVARLYECEIETGQLRPATAVEVSLRGSFHTISPDGKLVAAQGANKEWAIFLLDPASTVPPRSISGLRNNEEPIRWSADGQTLFVLDYKGSVWKLDPGSGRRELYRAVRADTNEFQVTPDGAAYVYGFGYFSSNLMLIEGLR
jgi:Tol biopolymer transport system component